MVGEFLTIAQVARRLGVSWITVRRAIQKGDLPATRIGRQYRIRVEALEAYIAVRAVTPLLKKP